ncbi:MAG TPA: hypothetical protein PK735_02370, partial [Flavobacteriales bacterium]|nr:hypothetical protein [Flavobacteriales bacterium]
WKSRSEQSVHQLHGGEERAGLLNLFHGAHSDPQIMQLHGSIPGLKNIDRQVFIGICWRYIEGVVLCSPWSVIG